MDKTLKRRNSKEKKKVTKSGVSKTGSTKTRHNVTPKVRTASRALRCSFTAPFTVVILPKRKGQAQGQAKGHRLAPLQGQHGVHKLGKVQGQTRGHRLAPLQGQHGVHK